MTQPFRLSGHPGAPLHFTFDGRALTGRVGDTLAAALLANGIHFVGRSFKYHRPRGIVAAGVEEPNAIMAVGSGARLDTNTQATSVELSEGLEARSINAWPSIRWDLGASIGWFGRFLPAGFYYKTFLWPHWRLFEGTIRRAAGLGTAPVVADPDRYERPHRHCDLCVVGSGPAGLAAALAAGRAGLDVIVAEQDFTLGGTLLWEEESIDGRSSAAWAAMTIAELAALPNVTLMPRTTVAGYHDHNLLLAVERRQAGRQAAAQRLWNIRAAHVVLATGAFERPMVFPNNDRPGILLASAIRQYVVRHRVLPGRRVVVATNNDDAYRTAFALLAAGVTVTAIVDSRTGFDIPAPPPGVVIHRGTAIVDTRGGFRVSKVIARAVDGSRSWHIGCDLVAMSGGWDPVVHLFSQSGGKLRYDESSSAFLPGQPTQKTWVVGSAAGAWSVKECLMTGAQAASAVVSGLGHPSVGEPIWRAGDSRTNSTSTDGSGRASIAKGARQWVDFHNDVTGADIALAVRENFHSVEHVKRYTTLGMAPDQGKTSNVNGLALLGELTGRSPGEVGTTTFRPPFTPILFGAIAGRDRGSLFRPSRHLPTHLLQPSHGAHLDDYGAWLRPAFYTQKGEEMAAAVRREVTAVRQAVGILDYSPLGKLEITGPDAVSFLNGVVATNLLTLKCGRARYSLTLTEGGGISDDGVVSRISEDVLLMGTTSGAADRIHALLEEWHQRQCARLKIHISNVTTQWGVLMLSGPKARDLLSRADIDIDLSATAFPHMAVREGTISGVPARVGRVSFTGEVSFEVSIPAGYTAALWRHLFAAGGDLGLTPIGIEALDVLRIEKGFIHIGTDTDGTTTPDDVGCGAMVRNKSSDFIGKRSLSLPAMRAPDRLQLIGLRPLDNESPLSVGSQLTMTAPRASSSGLGHVTSSIWSPTFARPVALGMLARGRTRIGEHLFAWHDSALRPVEVIEPMRYDPEGALLNG
jgi:sarcosine oxidase subunit alpha